jgi:hypothetical protein
MTVHYISRHTPDEIKNDIIERIREIKVWWLEIYFLIYWILDILELSIFNFILCFGW